MRITHNMIKMYDKPIFLEQKNDSDSEYEEIDYPDEENYENDHPSYLKHKECDNDNMDMLNYSEYNHFYTINPSISSLNTSFVHKNKVMPRFRVDGDTCPICLEDCKIYSKCQYCSVQCGTLFHTICISNLKRSNIDCKTVCPICRVESNFLTCDNENVSELLN